ncbi:hypothetical protein BJ742DRAFT_778886 [Cladochytrium replicatum]|nr:hypothetical protein BJ742DRAFT_778886 [Cladochytrium replicatum]
MDRSLEYPFLSNYSPNPQRRSSTGAMVNHEVVLPPCVYPASNPYGGFTTLVHRYGRYDRIRSSLIDDCAIALRSNSSTSSDFSPELSAIHEEDANPSNIQLARTRSLGGASVTKRDRNAAIDVISYQMNKPALREYHDQRVVLTPKKEIKLELARLGSAVEKFYKSVNLETMHNE